MVLKPGHFGKYTSEIPWEVVKCGVEDQLDRSYEK